MTEPQPLSVILPGVLAGLRQLSDELNAMDGVSTTPPEKKD